MTGNGPRRKPGVAPSNPPGLSPRAVHPVLRSPGEDGSALLLVLMCTMLLMGLGAGLAMLATTEVRIAAHFGAGIETLYAADAAIERVLPDLAAAADWEAVAAGSVPSTFVDGGSAGPRTMPDGTPLDLAAATTLERCGRPAACSDEEAEVPWRVYAHVPIRDVLPPGRLASRVYVIVWVADAGTSSGVELVLRARAYGPYGARRAVEVAIARHEAGLRVLSWREL